MIKEMHKEVGILKEHVTITSHKIRVIGNFLNHMIKEEVRSTNFDCSHLTFNTTYLERKHKNKVKR